MRRNNQGFSILFLFSVAVFCVSCSKTTLDDDANMISYSDYYKLNVGQSFLYRLDSTVLLSFGADTLTKSYYLKDSVMQKSIDLSGDTTYRISSYIRAYSTTGDWQYLTSYNVIPKSNRLELVDNKNLRFIKLTSPVSNGFSWDGNAYFLTGATIGTDSSWYNYLNWNYQYTNINSPLTFNGTTYNNTVTVSQCNDSSGIFSSANYYFKKLAVESYGKGQGLLHRKFLFLTYQGSSGYESTSYGVELTRIQ